jgi:Bacterial pre-peptidase C-terminal domain
MKVVAVSQFRQSLYAIALLLLFVSDARAQLPSTRLSAVFPPGAQAGTTVDVTLTSGLELEEISRLLFTHPGISATPKTQDVGGKPVVVANQFAVTVAADVTPGNYEIRTVGFFGISNPRTFVVGVKKELNETEPNNAREQAVAIDVNQTVNSRINGATDVDWYKFTGTAGQRILIDCVARRIDSKLDAALEIYNTAGKRLDFARKNLVSQDALIDLTLPADGVYFVKVYDFTYAGGEDYPYRLTITTGPYIDFVVPAAGEPGSNSQYTLFGRNLPGGQPAGIVSHGHQLEKLVVNIPLPVATDLLDPKLTLEPYSAGIDAVPYVLNSSTGPSNVVMIQFSNAPPTVEIEPNNKGAQAQKIVVPSEIDGQFQARNDIDCFQFDAKAKETYWIEVIAHRAGAALDPVVVIDQVKTNDKGEETLTRISALDDDPTNPLANLFDTLSDDNVVKFIAPADGTFRITLRERYGNSKQDLGVYRLIVRKETPDFRVVAVASALTPPGQRQAAPSGITLRRGDNFPVQVVVFRRDGFAGPITVSAEGLPPGVTCRDISIGVAPPNGILVFSSAEDAPAWAGTIRLVSRARIDDPTASEALTAVQATAKAAADALAAADKAIARPTEDLTKLNEALAAAKTELAAKPEDEGLKKKVTEAETKVTAAAAALKTVADARTAAEQKVNETKAAVVQAETAKNAAAREVTHAARYGTIVWGAPQPNIPGDARLSESIELSVMEEPSPYQITTDIHRVEANHNRQILVPVKVARRNGFDQPVNITVLGQPPNTQVENKPIPKEKTDEVFRLFVPPNAPVGTYVTYLTGQAAVSYRKNPAKADRMKAEFTAAEQAANAAAEALKTATATKDAAVKKAADDTANLKKLTEAKLQSDKALADAQAAEKVAFEAVKNAGDNADVKAAAEKKLVDSQSATKAATDAQAAAEKARADAELAGKQAEEAKAKAEAEAKAADDKNKTTAAEKAAADQRFKAADAYAKASNINFHPTTTPIIITVKPAPYTLTAAPADGGNVKVGAKIEVKCEVKRQNGFVGPVTLTLPLPPSVAGIKAEPVTIPADQSAGVLIVEAAADAAEAQLANMVVRATSQFEGEAAVDQPINLKITK